MLLLTSLIRICNGQFSELENTVLAEPRVDCGVESITVSRVDQPECVHSYAKNWGSDSKGPSDSRGADFTIRFGQCNMRRQRLLKQRGVDGPLMKYATIGEPITHLWQCDPVAGWLYGLLIHSCFVDDGHGKNRFDLINERGCVTDRSLLAEISYDEKAFTAYAHTHVFRYADSKSSLSLKDSPILTVNSNDNGSSIAEQLLSASMSSNNHSRAGRNAAIEFVNNRMETDLSAGTMDLTVVPRTINGMAERSNNKDEHVAGMGSTFSILSNSTYIFIDPFIRVFPIRSREYFAATPHFYSLDSQSQFLQILFGINPSAIFIPSCIGFESSTSKIVLRSLTTSPHKKSTAHFEHRPEIGKILSSKFPSDFKQCSARQQARTVLNRQ
uniref:ZP domain-containing protein n=1 Tax=Meloidogyne hapla TaxID=6305 RepID=A0A1I8BPZ3_MELHA